MITFQGRGEHIFTLGTFLTTEHFLEVFFCPRGHLLDASQNWIQGHS